MKLGILWKGIVLLFCLSRIALAAGGIGGTGSPQGGIGGTGLIDIGFIQRFGSIFVNGSEYELDAQTRYVVDGVVVNALPLHLGEAVQVSATLRNGRWLAQAVTIEHALAGRVDSIDLATRSLSLLGQTVVLAEEVQIHAPQGGLQELSTLQPGVAVQISALAIGEHRWLAYGVTILAIPAHQPAPVLLRGTVTHLMTQTSTVMVNGVSATLSPHLLPTLHLGDQLQLVGEQQHGTLHFTQARRLPKLPISPVTVLGLVSPDGQQLHSPVGEMPLATTLPATPEQAALLHATLDTLGQLNVQHIQHPINPMTINLPAMPQHGTPATQMLMRNGMVSPNLPRMQIPGIHIPVIPMMRR